MTGLEDVVDLQGRVEDDAAEIVPVFDAEENIMHVKEVFSQISAACIVFI